MVLLCVALQVLRNVVSDLLIHFITGNLCLYFHSDFSPFILLFILLNALPFKMFWPWKILEIGVKIPVMGNS